MEPQPSRPTVAAYRSPYMQPAVGAPVSYRYNTSATGAPAGMSYRI